MELLGCFLHFKNFNCRFNKFSFLSLNLGNCVECPLQAKINSIKDTLSTSVISHLKKFSLKWINYIWTQERIELRKVAIYLRLRRFFFNKTIENINRP